MSGPGQTLFSFVRHWSRRCDQGRLVLVVEAASSLDDRSDPTTVNAIAAEIGMDQSGASRLVTEAVTAGYLTPKAARDARRREVSVTTAGRDLLRDAHRWQEEVFAQLTAGWSETERAGFHRGMRRLLSESRRS